MIAPWFTQKVYDCFSLVAGEIELHPVNFDSHTGYQSCKKNSMKLSIYTD